MASLKRISEQMPNGPELAILLRHIVDLLGEQRSSLDFAASLMAPNEYDVFILDVVLTEDLSRIGAELNSTPLSPALGQPSFAVRGILFGQGQRIFVPLIVARRAISVNVIFLFDTASPNSYLQRETLAALGFQGSIPSKTNVVIHGTAMTVHVSSNHFENVDLLGQDYFVAIRGLVTIDYPLRSLEISMK